MVKHWTSNTVTDEVKRQIDLQIRKDRLMAELYPTLTYDEYVMLVNPTHILIGDSWVTDNIIIMQLCAVGFGLIPIENMKDSRSSSDKAEESNKIRRYMLNKLSFALECVNVWMLELRK